jgi:aryl-alcohol dehydrogenase-like predicted oxidoreductase
VGYGAMQLPAPGVFGPPPRPSTRARSATTWLTGQTKGYSTPARPMASLTFPFFPLGSAFAIENTALTAPAVVTSATRLGITPAQVALAWLLQRSPNVLLIPGTSSLSHARENLAAAAVKLDHQALADIG